VAKVASAIRRADAAAAAPDPQVDGGEEEAAAATLVLIPADPTEPLQEIALPSSQPSAAGADPSAMVLEFLRPRFRTQQGSGGVDLSRLDPGARTLLASGGGGGGGAEGSLPPVSDATLLKVAQDDVHIETFTVVHPSPEGRSDGTASSASLVYYLDEIGALKHLPANRRASSYAARAGYEPPPTFYGDVYAGRASPGARRPLPCRVSDLECVDRFARGNLERQAKQNRLAGRPAGFRQPDAAGTGDDPQSEAGFSWRQTEADLEITVPLPGNSDGSANLLTSRQVKVAFRPQSLRVTALGASVLDVRLFERVDVDSCTWTLESGQGDGPESAGRQSVVVSMEKAEEALWPRVLD
jgi:hypothetical protein